ncbi:hypothetical protein B0H14DRAFT_2577879 [Mycena olivaceomarginata]|nr:hypothetical protein B0H14DRAFT_2577879 [Mycena olivaceomarginata]
MSTKYTRQRPLDSKDVGASLLRDTAWIRRRLCLALAMVEFRPRLVFGGSACLKLDNFGKEGLRGESRDGPFGSADGCRVRAELNALGAKDEQRNSGALLDDATTLLKMLHY